MSLDDRPRRPRNARGEGGRLRDDIVGAAHHLLDEGGEDAVTLRAIARRIGISAPSIYRHFDDRQAILLAVAREAFEELASVLRAAVGAGTDPADRPRAVCEAYLGFARDRPRRYLIMFGGVWDAGPAVEAGVLAPAEVGALGAEALAIIDEALRGGGREPSATGRDLARAVVVWVGLHGLAHQRLVAPGFPWPPEVEHRLISALVA